MRGIIIALVVCAPAVASAGVQLKGWTADGQAVVEVNDPMSTWSADWIGDASHDDFWAVCSPEGPDSDAADGEGGHGCMVCQGADDCGLAIDASSMTPSKKSPNKKIKVTDKRKCSHYANSPDGKLCIRTIGFGKKGSIEYQENTSKDKATLAVFFRPDSGVAVVTFEGHGGIDGSVDLPGLYVVDLGGGLVSGGARNGIGYAFALDGKQTHRVSDDDTGGSAKVVLDETLGGTMSKMTVEKVKLYASDSLLGHGEPIVFGKDLTPALQVDGKLDSDDFSSDLAGNVKAHLPEGTITAAGWVIEGDHDAFDFVIYALVPDGGSVKVVKQTWSDDVTAPHDETKVDLQL